MIPSRAFVRRASAAFLGFAQVVFLLAAVAPRMVWCTKPDGRPELEFESAPGACRCSECPFCLARTRAGGPSPAASLDPTHCRHEEIRSEAGRSAGLLKGGQADKTAAGAAGLTGPAAGPARPGRAGAARPSIRDGDAGPPGGSVRRC